MKKAPYMRTSRSPAERILQVLIVLAVSATVPATAEIPPVYSVQLDPYSPNWISLDALKHHGTTGEMRAERLSDKVEYLHREGKIDQEGCYVTGEDPHAPDQKGYRAIEAFRDSPAAARSHANLIVTGIVRDAAVGTAGLDSVGTLLEVAVLAEHKRGLEIDDLLRDLQRSSTPDFIYVFVPYARFVWDGRSVCLRDVRFTSTPAVGEAIGVLLYQDYQPERRLSPEQRRERERLLESGEMEVWPLNPEKVMFLSPDTTAIFALDRATTNSQVWKGQGRAFESRAKLEQWLETGL